MNIRRKITLWVAGAGLFTSLVSSLVVFMEMREQPFELLDQELGSTAQAIASQITMDNNCLIDGNTLTPGIPGTRYWIKVLDTTLKPVCQSGVSGLGDIPLYDKGDDGYTVQVRLAENSLSPDQENDEEVPFRVRAVPVQIRGTDHIVQIAKPIEGLEDEISELVVALVTGLFVSFAFLCVLSNYVAGKIVKPISDINRLSKEINERTLEKRIPMGKCRDEIYELSQSLNSMFDRLQFSFRRQKEFLASASHELKSPTAMLKLFFEEAARQECLPESFRKDLMQQSKNALRMERLAKTLLELSALELAPSVDKDLFSLTQLIQDLLEDFSVVFRANNMQVSLDSPENLKISGDRNKIRRMLINLLDNAVKYNDENGEIKIEAFPKNNAVHLSVFNTGPGIPEDELVNVFDQFHRVEKSRSMQYGGAGLGLSIVRQIVQLHGGHVRMESQSGQWARVHVTFPCDRCLSR
ncbi:MAG: HAMP domain-containing histidine kinase [Desulfatibacillum sp.]|nr:HAMP domain-containing histidine kinase [Desulfatibacillum sp.]